MGTIQFALGAATGELVSALGNGTAVPFAAVIAGCGLAAFAVHRTVGSRLPAPG
jgi:DHA1 family bicyclomycin/chloramphenicol resistance-like MFS transporter